MLVNGSSKSNEDVDISAVVETNVNMLLQYGRENAAGEFLIAVHCLGSTVQTVLPNLSWINPLIEYLPPGWNAVEVSDPSDQDIYCLSPSISAAALSEPYSSKTDRPALENFAKKIEYAVAERSQDYVFVHAGVVAVNGELLLFPGESFSGKSTLVAALVQQGATYFSDEYAVVTTEGIVLPYPRPISLRTGLYFKEGRTDLSDFGPSANHTLHGLPASKIMFLTYESESELQVEAIDYPSALIELSKNTVAFRDRPDMSFSYLHNLLNRAQTLRGKRGSADGAARRIRELL